MYKYVPEYKNEQIIDKKYNIFIIKFTFTYTYNLTINITKNMKKPLATYNMETNETDCGDYSRVLWSAILDRRYKCEVQRTAPYKGELLAFDSQNNDKLVYEIAVPISYNGQFSPDIVDVATWQDLLIEKIDENIDPPYVKLDV